MVSATEERLQPPLMAGEPLKMKYTSVATASIPIPQYGTGPDVDLVENIRSNGILEPLLVREERTESGGKVYRLLEGRRRLISANRIEMSRIPVLIVSGDMSDDAIRLSVHGLRRNNPVMECQAIAGLVRAGHTESEIAKKTGFSTATVQERQAYLRLIPELLEAFYDGKIPASVAKAASALTIAQQNRCLEIFEEKKKLTAKDVKAQRLAANVNSELLDLDTPDDDGGGSIPDNVRAVLMEVIAQMNGRALSTDESSAIAQELQAILDS